MIPLSPGVIRAALTAVTGLVPRPYDRAAFDADLARVTALLPADGSASRRTLLEALDEAADASMTGAQCEAAVRATAFARVHRLTWADVTPRHATMLPPPSPDALAAAKWPPRTPATPDEPLDEHDPLDDSETP